MAKALPPPQLLVLLTLPLSMYPSLISTQTQAAPSPSTLTLFAMLL